MTLLTVESGQAQWLSGEIFLLLLLLKLWLPAMQEKTIQCKNLLPALLWQLFIVCISPEGEVKVTLGSICAALSCLVCVPEKRCRPPFPNSGWWSSLRLPLCSSLVHNTMGWGNHLISIAGIYLCTEVYGSKVTVRGLVQEHSQNWDVKVQGSKRHFLIQSLAHCTHVSTQGRRVSFGRDAQTLWASFESWST